MSDKQVQWDRCPVCGRRFGGEPTEHRCPPRVLAAIDAAHDHDDDDTDRRRPATRAERLNDGFLMLGLMGDDDPCGGPRGRDG